MKSWVRIKKEQTRFVCRPTVYEPFTAPGCKATWWDDERPSWCPNPACVSVRPEDAQAESGGRRG